MERFYDSRKSDSQQRPERVKSSVTINDDATREKNMGQEVRGKGKNFPPLQILKDKIIINNINIQIKRFKLSFPQQKMAN